MTARCMH